MDDQRTHQLWAFLVTCTDLIPGQWGGGGWRGGGGQEEGPRPDVPTGQSIFGNRFGDEKLKQSLLAAPAHSPIPPHYMPEKKNRPE